MFSETSENDLELIHQNAREEPTVTVVPEISKEKYATTYNSFVNWRKEHNMTTLTENDLLIYFADIAKKFKPSTLWTHYSILKAMINVNDKVNIMDYNKLKAFLKRQSTGYKSKKSKVFTSEEINKFINEAPDKEYLLAKVVLIMGITGACRREELYKMKVTNFKDLQSAVLVELPNPKTKTTRKFTITGRFYDIFKRYSDLRPEQVNDPYFFLNYMGGKCTNQRVGINKLGSMGKTIATYLGLPNPESYTGHCFRRSSGLKRHGGWKFCTLAEDFSDDSLNYKNVETVLYEEEDEDSTQQEPEEEDSEMTMHSIIQQSLNVKNEPYEDSTSFHSNLLEKLDDTTVEEEDADKAFLYSLLPDVRKLNDDEKLDFRLHCLQFFRDLRRRATQSFNPAHQSSSNYHSQNQPSPHVNFNPMTNHSSTTCNNLLTPISSSISSPEDPNDVIKVEVE